MDGMMKPEICNRKQKKPQDAQSAGTNARKLYRLPFRHSRVKQNRLGNSMIGAFDDAASTLCCAGIAPFVKMRLDSLFAMLLSVVGIAGDTAVGTAAIHAKKTTRGERTGYIQGTGGLSRGGRAPGI
jgi:hypothetical protein